MKHTSSSPASSLASQFAAWRKRQSAAKLGAVALLSLANARSAERQDNMDAVRQIAQTVAARSTDDNTQDEETRGAVSRFVAADETAPAHVGVSVGAYLLTPSERAALTAARPGALSVVFRVSPVVVEVSDPLPADFIPAAVADFCPATEQLSADELAEIARESAAEIAAFDAAEIAAARIAYATAFRSDFEAQFSPIDYSPDAGAPRQLITMRAPCAALAPVVVTPAVAVDVDVAQMDFAALRAAVLATAGKRRK
jgi:hypothetical protein